jgi:hypothetical protein
MNRFVLKNTFIKIYIYHFLINIFMKTRSQSYAFETVSLSKTTSFSSTEGVLAFFSSHLKTLHSITQMFGHMHGVLNTD